MGHPLTLAGVYGPPRRLVTDTTVLVCEAAANASAEAEGRLRFVLLSTAGVDNPVGHEQGVRSPAERALLAVLAAALPPYADSVQATDRVAKSPLCRRGVEWVVLRPDDFAEGPAPPGGYLALASPNSLFNAKTTHIASIGDFAADLLISDAMWKRWRGRMPYLIDAE